MRWLVLIGLCACDRVLGLDHATPADAFDAAFFDAPESFVCPPIGTTPKYSPELREAIDLQCDSYTASANGLALGVCRPSVVPVIMTGTLGTMPSLASGFDDPNVVMIKAAIGSDGSALVLVSTLGTSGTDYEYRTYGLQANGSWSRGPDVLPRMPTSAGGYLIVSTPSTTVPRHIVYGDNNISSTSLRELVDDGTGGWTDAPWSPTPYAGLGFVDLQTVRLSGDGLRILLEVQDTAT